MKTGVPDVERKQQLYCNQIVSWWEMTFEVGGDTEDALRQAAAGLFTSDVSRRWWGRQRTYRKGATSRGKRLHRILNEEWMLATLNHEARAAAAHAETGASEWE